jgi:hypothetical protein
VRWAAAAVVTCHKLLLRQQLCRCAVLH